MFFRRKKKDKNKNHLSYNDQQIHRTFQLGAVIMLIVIIYGLYFDKDAAKNQNLNSEQINKRIEQTLKSVSENKEFQQVKEFVDFVNLNADKKNGNILNVKDGVIIYVPNSMLETTSPLEIENDKLKSIITKK